MSPLNSRIAGAPASWGICELPGWGYQFSPDRVLSEMQQLGLTATELGPDDFFPLDPQEKVELLATYGLTALGAFCPLILFDTERPVRDIVQRTLETFNLLGARTMVIAAATGTDSYDERPSLTDSQWRTLMTNLDLIAELADDHGVAACVHPHMGTLVQNRDEVARILDGSDIPLCLDTGHITVAGGDPLEIVQSAPHRISHVHVKDVNLSLAAAVQAGGVAYSDAVRDGLYTPLGDGDLDLTSIVRDLETSGYRGWYVPELDQMLPADAEGMDSMTGIRRSMEFLDALLLS